ncbi:oleate hydratase [Paenibacillus thiaminolyticus]|uniref:oleate hydratase n=1 Tax=Paenibacillus thiaminolyticus TaxID=49283 RepID=UPI0035A730EA
MSTEYNNKQVYFVGGGIASLAGAAFLVRDCDFPGSHVHIMKEMWKPSPAIKQEQAPCHIQGVQLADVDCAGASAAFPEPAGACPRVLGLRSVPG